jgi:hypothetical protein
LTEREWLTSTDPQAMLASLRGTGVLSERKARLFVAACCRRVWHLLTDDKSREAVEVAERYADGLATQAELADAHWVCGDFATSSLASFLVANAAGYLSGDDSGMEDAAVSVLDGLTWSVLGGEALDRVAAAEQHAALLHDLFGPLPFRPESFPPSALAWSDGLVVKLAASIYEGRRLPQGSLAGARVGVLADALEDAGCTDEELLLHFRREGQSHWRGCWGLDVILGRG